MYNYPNPMQGGGPVTLTAHAAKREYWITHVHFRRGGYLILRWEGDGPG